eukprot:Trichotokara_eunicae@DN3781_c0_g1_i1.p1
MMEDYDFGFGSMTTTSAPCEACAATALDQIVIMIQHAITKGINDLCTKAEGKVKLICDIITPRPEVFSAYVSKLVMAQFKDYPIALAMCYGKGFCTARDMLTAYLKIPMDELGPSYTDEADSDNAEQNDDQTRFVDSKTGEGPATALSTSFTIYKV